MHGKESEQSSSYKGISKLGTTKIHSNFTCNIKLEMESYVLKQIFVQLTIILKNKNQCQQ